MPSNELSRRAFLRDSTLTAGALATGVVAEQHTAMASPADRRQIRSFNADMEYRPCGQTGLMISAITLGGHWKRVNRLIPKSFPKAIEEMCAECHDTHDAPAAKVIAMWQDKCPARTNPDQLLCTDCHGMHRMKFRTVWWDKSTGKLGERKPGEKYRANIDLRKSPVNESVKQ